MSGPDGLIDTHAHLCDPRFDPDREAVLARAGAGVLRDPFFEFSPGKKTERGAILFPRIQK
ncbi:MAG: hypothetical protein A2902_01055 [Elusimicrobia bacterium RIFCSPLOWO2_01_FULL_64_13]|nr:MAG: hypothetical protein A2902_01055 [Elusimicrobia bacterium RIFCSPLOWO2_01_FULL_64_13]